jgi:hypothetical protein
MMPRTTTGNENTAQRISSFRVKGGVSTLPAAWRMNMAIITRLKTSVYQPSGFTSPPTS